MYLKTLWHEPLLHFLLLGFALFGYYELSGDETEAPPKRIVVGSGQVEQLTNNFQRTWMRPPTPDELDELIESHVREEVFYREALAMGLDQNDPIVRRRMRMKLEFILDDLSTQVVDDAVLETYLQQHAENFRVETQVSFSQVFLNPDRRPELDADATQILADLNAGADPDTLGDATLAPRSYQMARQSEVERDFGNEFARSVVSLPPGNWSGPHDSPFGAHLVRVDNRLDARLPALAEVRDRVLQEYQAQQREKQKDLAYEKLRETYEVTIEPLENTKSTGAGLLLDANASEAQ